MTIKHITLTIAGAVSAVALASLGVAAQVDAPRTDAPPAESRGGVDDNNQRFGETRDTDARNQDDSQAEGDPEARAERDGALPDQRALPDERARADERALPDERARAGEESDRDLPEGDLDRDDDDGMNRDDRDGDAARDRGDDVDRDGDATRDRGDDGDRTGDGARMDDGYFMGGGQMQDEGRSQSESQSQPRDRSQQGDVEQRDRAGETSDARTGGARLDADEDVREGGPQVAMLVTDGRIERVGVDGAAHAHFTIVNRGSPDELKAISTRTASMTSLRVAPDREDPRVTQVVTDGVPVLNGTSMEFAESGNVAVLCGMSPNVKDGDTVNVTLWFDRAGAIEVPFVVGGEEALTTEEVVVDDE